MAVPSYQYTADQLNELRKNATNVVSGASPLATAGVTMGSGNDMTLTKRMNAGAASMAASNQPNTLGSVQPEKPSYDIFSRPGDSFGDSQMREQQYMSLLKDAAQAKGRKRGSMVDAAKAMIAPGLAQIEAQNKDYQALLSQYGQQQSDMTKLGMLGGMDPQQMQNFMFGLSQIYGGNQSQPSVYGNQSQPQATTPAPTTTQPVGTNPQASSLPGTGSFTDQYNRATDIYKQFGRTV